MHVYAERIKDIDCRLWKPKLTELVVLFLQVGIVVGRELANNHRLCFDASDTKTSSWRESNYLAEVPSEKLDATYLLRSVWWLLENKVRVCQREGLFVERKQGGNRRTCEIVNETAGHPTL